MTLEQMTMRATVLVHTSAHVTVTAGPSLAVSAFGVCARATAPLSRARHTPTSTVLYCTVQHEQGAEERKTLEQGRQH